MRVAIIGAGFSGMLAAYQLEKKGIDVTVYEKEEYIGGHFRTLINSDFYIELGTVFSFSSPIKTLLLELNIEFSERFSYRNFVDEHYNNKELLSRFEVAALIEELSRLEKILQNYASSINTLNYGTIHEDLLVPLYDFLNFYNLPLISQLVAPHFSSFGFGTICETQAFYAFSIFNLNTILSFLRGDKLLFIDKGVSEVIQKLSQNISDIRYAVKVINIENSNQQVKVETPYGFDLYDKVLITTKLPRDVIKDQLFNQLMKKIDTNPYFTCAYEVESKHIVTTYFMAHFGQQEKIQFFYAYKHNERCILVAYAYGHISPRIINTITADIERTGIKVNHLITAKQWYIFPHLKASNLTSSFYEDIAKHQKNSPISLIGSLVSMPAISNLYSSVTGFIEENFFHV